MPKLLIVDDEQNELDMLSEMFRIEEYEVETAQSAAIALDKLGTQAWDLVFLDIDLRGDGKDRTGVELLKKIRETWDEKMLPVVVISGVGDTQLLQQIRKLGSTYYKVKPVEPRELIALAKRLVTPPAESESMDSPDRWHPYFVGRSKVMMNLVDTVIKHAEQENDLLVLGETGTGKELIAELYRQNSPRNKENYAIVNCPAIPASMFEAEIFGYVKGAFTGANQDKPGLIEAGQAGIVYFDEIGELTPENQAKLLRLLENRKFSRLGSTEKIVLNAKFIFATLKDLAGMVKAGLYRQDLVQRIWRNVVVIPPLREHRDDLELLIGHFIQEGNERYQKNVKQVLPEVIDFCRKYPWEGNTRQLENAILHGVARSVDEHLTWTDLETFFLKPNQASVTSIQEFDRKMSLADFKEMVETIKRKYYQVYLNFHLEQHRRNRSRTAEALGISRENLKYLMQQYQVEAEPEG